MHSFKNRLLTLIVALMALAEGVTIVLALVYLNQGVRTQSAQDLQAARTVLDRTLDSRARQLRAAADVVVADFAFREAVASGDRPTIVSALQNHARRIDANVAILFDIGGAVLASTIPEAAAATQRPPVDGDADGATSYAVIDGRPYQLVFAQLRAPQPIAWVALGFALDQSLAAQLRSIAAAEISFVARDQHGSYVTSTLRADEARGALDHAAAGASGDQPVETEISGQRYLTLTASLPARNGTIDIVMQRSLDQALAQFRKMWLALTLIGLATLVAAIVVAGLAGRSAVKPLAELVKAAVRIARGNYDQNVSVKGGEEFQQLAGTFNVMQDGIRQREQRIFEQATLDSLTGFANRSALRQQLEARLQGDVLFTLVMIDVHRFRDLNASVGHQAGDKLLCALAARLQLLVGSASGCARLGADQFAIGLAMHDDAALQRMNLLAAELRQGVLVDGVQLSVEFRSGIAEWQPQVSVDDFIRQAGVALVEAKERGTHAVVFQPAHDIEHRRRITLVAELRRAITNGGLSLAYQPLVQMTNREAVMLEALVRWRHPTLGDVSPAEFIPLAERASVIADLSRWLMDAAIGQLGRWRRAGLNIDLAINLSASDMSDTGLPVRVLALLQQHQVPATQLLLEVTESTIIREPVLAAQVMTQLRSAGVRFAVDDFGTGHSSLAQLHSLPVDELKIDRAFIMNLDRTSSDQAIVRSTIELGHILGLRVVAEGVETPEVWSVLVRLGCDLAQGYFISRPMPADVVPGWMSTQRARLSHALTAAESDGTVSTLRPRIGDRSVS